MYVAMWHFDACMCLRKLPREVWSPLDAHVCLLARMQARVRLPARMRTRVLVRARTEMRDAI